MARVCARSPERMHLETGEDGSPVPRLAGLVNWRRLAVAVPLLAGLIVTAYLLSPGSGGDTIEDPVLLDTPGAGTQAARVGMATGDLAPNFEVSTPDGHRVQLADLRGRPVLINFWARWCTSCLSEMPVIKEVQGERGIEAFTVLAINAGETRPQAQEFIDFLQAPFVYGLDPNLTIADAYGVRGLPLSVFVDATGVIQAVYRGHANRDLFENLLSAAINAQPPGPIPPIIRIVSTIPREKVLVIRVSKGGRLEVSSKLLRCDATFCGRPALEEIAGLAGVKSVTPVPGPGSPGAVVAYDEATVSGDQLVERISAIIRTLQDPLYDGQIVVRYASN